jgi:DNA-binding CsgD family transcriptional regulator
VAQPRDVTTGPLGRRRRAAGAYGRGLEAARQHELLPGLGQYRVDAGLIFCQEGTLGRVGLPFALSLCVALGPLSPPGHQSLILGVSVPRCLLDSPDEVLKLTSRDRDPDPSLWAGPHLALSPGETHPMTELPEPGVLARAVLPQARPAAAHGDLQFDKSLAGLVDGADPGDRAGLVAWGVWGVDHAVHSARRGSAAAAGKGTKNLLCAYLAIAVFTGLLASEAAAQAATAHTRAGRGDSARRALALSGRFLDQCEDVRSPVLAAVQLAPAQLTRREREIVDLVGQGASNAEIAERLVLSVRTVESHLYRAMAKLGIGDRHELRLLRASTGQGDLQ